jgi:LysR family transcriptional regulator, glycine cleavage system transcriptional activator
MKNLPPLNYIRSFEASARHLSFTRAAEELGLTQAAVSGHVRALESYLGRPLFYRGPRSLGLTEVAASYLPSLRQALSQIDAATGQVMTARHRHAVILACPASLATNWLPQRLRAFHALHPDYEVVVHATIWSETSDQIADLRISPRHDSQPWLGHRLMQDSLAMVCAPEFLTGDAPMQGPGDIVRFGIIHVLGRQENWDAFCLHHGIGSLHAVPGCKTDSSNVALEMAAVGMGCTIAPRALADVHLRRGLLAEPFPAPIPSSWGYDLHAGELAATRASDRLRQFLIAEAA